MGNVRQIDYLPAGSSFPEHESSRRVFLEMGDWDRLARGRMTYLAADDVSGNMCFGATLNIDHPSADSEADIFLINGCLVARGKRVVSVFYETPRRARSFAKRFRLPLPEKL